MTPEERLLAAIFGEENDHTRDYDLKVEARRAKLASITKHIAWDYGIVSDIIPGKTTKTLCGRRVTHSHIDNNHPTCTCCIDNTPQPI